MSTHSSSPEPESRNEDSTLTTYIHEQRTLLQEFERRFVDDTSRSGDGSISDSWQVAWRQLNEEPRVINTYIHRPLDHDRKEHRVVIIHPASSYLDTIKISIDHVFFSEDDMPEYEALSYVCGDATKNLITIKVVDKDENSDEAEIDIGHNLSTALRYLRLLEKPRTIWCDALCINQQDNQEKGVEILRMSDIYRKAKRVIIWMGPEADKSGTALKALSHVGKQVQMNWSWDEFRLQTQEGKDPRWSYGNYDLPFDNTTWHSIRMLISRTWFERLWVWQEATLAQETDSILVCGRDEIGWETFRRAIMCLTFNMCNPPDWSPFEIQSYRGKLEHVSNLVRCKIQTNMIGILNFTSKCRCFDPRDRVYAVLSFSDSQHSFFSYITPDYSKTKRQVYLDLFLSVYEKLAKSLTLLALSHKGKGDVPTWLPDYETVDEHVNVLHGWATGRSAGIFKLLDNESLIASVSGVFSGTVELCAKPMPPQPSRQEIIAVVKEWFQEIVDYSTYPTGIEPLVAFALTLTRNAVKEYHPGPTFIPTIAGIRRIALRDFLTEGGTDDIDMHYGTPQWYDYYYERLLDYLPGFCFGRMSNGYFGLFPPDTKTGDHIYTILGCPVPLILRKQESGSFTVVGSCFLDGHMEAQALLGEVADNFRIVFKNGDIEGGMYFLNLETRGATRLDPRLGDLPLGWRQICYSDGQLCWLDSEGEVQHCDPRLTPEALSARGVQVVDLALV